jgi:hypothetical protein
VVIQATRPTTAAIATAIQNHSHGDTEPLLVAAGVAVSPGVTEGTGATTAPEEVLVGRSALVGLDSGLRAGLVAGLLAGLDSGPRTGLEAGALLGSGAVVAGSADVAAGSLVVGSADVAAGGDEGAEVRVAVMLAVMLPTTDDRLPPAPHPARRQVMTTIRPTKPVVFRTLDPLNLLAHG